jgi:hypothetical protein
LTPPPLYSESLPIPSGWFCLGAASDFSRGTETIDVHVWGLGYSRVHVTDLSWGLDLRLLVMATLDRVLERPHHFAS